MPSVVRFYPYAFSGEIDLRASEPYDPTQENVSFDWLLRPDETDEAFLTLNLAAGDVEWHELRFDVEAVLARSELERLLPATSNVGTDTEMLLSVRCPATKSRESIRLGSAGLGRWRGHVHLRRALVRNVVEVRPMLVRKTGIPGGLNAGNFATEKNAIIAEGRALRIVVDETLPPIHGTIDVAWEDFRHSNNLWRKEHSADVFYLETSGELPKLWLNSRYANLKAALHSPGAYGVEAVVRHLTNGMIAQTVWLQMFSIAAAEVNIQEEGSEIARPSGWRGSVLDAVLPRMFPNLTTEEQIRELAGHMESPEQAGPLLSKAASAVQSVVGSYKLVEKAIRAGERRV